MLNRSKGPAMWSPRAQCDKTLFTIEWRKELESIKEDYLNQGGKVIQSGYVKKEKVDGCYYYIEKDAIVLELLLRKKGKQYFTINIGGINL